MIINYLSDIHLEFFKPHINFDKVFRFPENGEILCLAGDIGYPESEIYTRFLQYCTKYFKYIYLIAGNHEYYCGKNKEKTIQKTNNLINKICSNLKNVYFLNNQNVYNEEYDIYIIGTTLWTETESSNKELLLGYNDFNQIYYEYQDHRCCMNEEYMDLLNSESIEFLEIELEKLKNSNSRVLVITHHLPTYELIHDKYKNHPQSFLFANHLDNYFEKYKIDAWICGHSHAKMNLTIKNTQLFLNPIGYPGENLRYNTNETFNL